ncbi:GntR family transcriptional regulator [Steroidobacter agaridevorans]|uniref:GntR family transcriptional regulator n=1 Tax=Steroidobacter agaridevorans TaxID=2695856 RepID=A0A829YH62_9GAMM|nr:PLP-dependent aminotransferase family protein [Steroidobacter agaridevorans]GFE82657.1 GntR family transcriptional regulator [Steroidobacter agaridevorans]GFE85744.1 GntR family transcriptional regulator [Steroidobacter agaridevorans]
MVESAEHLEPTLVGQVMRLIQTRIDRRQYTPGARIPSVRAMAESMGVSKSTVVEAYGRLAAEGIVQPRLGSGFYVAAPLAPLNLAELSADTDPTVDPLWVMRQSLRPGEDSLRPGCGWLPESWMPHEMMRKALRSAARDGSGPTLFEYGPAQGADTLRALITRRLLEQGVEAVPDQVMITDSCTQAIDLVCRFLLEPGDTVLVDDPCYFNFKALLRAHRAHVVGVPFTANGPDLSVFASLLEAHRPRIYLTNSGLQNPTGASLTAPVAHRLLKLSEPYGLVIVEDDIFGDFEEQPSPRLAAFDGLDRVVRVSSFSKTLSASMRCGYIACRPDWLRGLADLRMVTGMASSPLNAELVASMLMDGSYRRHVERIRTRLSQQRQIVKTKLARLGIVPFVEPAGGMFLWCQLPEGCDAAKVARLARAENVVLAPGNAFSVSGAATRFVRFNVTQMEGDKVYAALRRAIG